MPGVRTLAAAGFVIGASLGLFLLLHRGGAGEGTTSAGTLPLLERPADGGASGDGVADAQAPRTRTFRVAHHRQDDGYTVTDGVVGKRLFSQALTKAGMSPGEATRVLHAFQGVRAFDRTNPRDTFVFSRDKATHRLVAFEYETVKGDVFQAREVDGKWSGGKLDIAVERHEVRFGFVVGAELKESMHSASVEYDMMKRLGDALDGHLSLSDIRRNGRLRIVATEARVDGAFSRYDKVLAVEYQSPRPKAPRLRVYAFGEGKQSAHYNERGERPYHGGFRFPIPLARITSRFNPRRMHPVLHRVMPHNGIDFAGTTGTPVYTVAPGTLKFAADSGPCGNMVQVQHAEDLVSAYCHLSKFAPGLKVGARVEGGQLVGYVGQTGRVTGPHLHFAMKRHGQFIDPLSLKMGGTMVLPKDAREAFAERRKELDAMLDAIAMPDAPPAAADEPDAGDEAEENLDDPTEGDDKPTP
jgi:hypothetical protein